LKYVFCNEITADFLKLSSPGEIVGMTDFDFGWDIETAKWIRQTDEEILRTGKPLLNVEATVKMDDGKNLYLAGSRVPLFNGEGEVTGILGITVDITAQKEAEHLAHENERLKFENATQQAIVQEQEKFKKVIDQATHDIRSPLASMTMIVGGCKTMQEKERLALRSAANKINDIANNLLNFYEKEKVDQDQASKPEQREVTLLSPFILQILSEKRFQFKRSSIRFDHHFTQTGGFCWINVKTMAFQRMLSNLINNAVDAIDHKEGTVTVRLDADDKQVRVIIEDNGKGMRPELIQKVMNQIAVTEGKKDGHGIGLTQVRETLQNHEGQLAIESEIGVGTKMILTFPRVPAQNWIADSIQLNDDDIVVVLDDDDSIHAAWDTRFDTLLTKFPNLTVKHFEIGQETIDFINGLAPEKKQKVFLLTDYELINQDLHGLNIIKQTAIQRSILVTSHYENKTVCQDAVKADTKILPKQLAHDIPIDIVPAHRNEPEQQLPLKNTEVIFVDDDQELIESYAFTFGQYLEVDTYTDPKEFLANTAQYRKDTKIILDYHYNNFEEEGIQLAIRLHDLRFTELYLLTGAKVSPRQIPDYLKLLSKADIPGLIAVLKGEGYSLEGNRVRLDVEA
jgi:signal transduction histidine kinase